MAAEWVIIGVMSEKSFDIFNPFDVLNFPAEDYADGIKEWAFANRSLFRELREPLDWVVNNTEAGLLGAPQIAILLAMGLIAWQAAGWRVGAAVIALLALMGVLGENTWTLGMTTQSQRRRNSEKASVLANAHSP